MDSLLACFLPLLCIRLNCRRSRSLFSALSKTLEASTDARVRTSRTEFFAGAVWIWQVAVMNPKEDMNLDLSGPLRPASIPVVERHQAAMSPHHRPNQWSASSENNMIRSCRRLEAMYQTLAHHGDLLQPFQTRRNPQPASNNRYLSTSLAGHPC